MNSDTRWYLAIDSNCTVCEEIGSSISPLLEDKVELISLNEGWVAELRVSHFGDRSPWAPTLISVRKTGKPQLWVGKKMAIRLATVIGARRALGIAKSLGEMRSVEDTSSVRNFVSRRTFFKQLAGISAGLTLASVVGETVLADEPGGCGILQTYGGYTSMTAVNANCRHCPSLGSPSAIGGSLLSGPIQFRYYAYGGGVPGSNSLWYRTAGTVGCWVHSSAVY